MSEQNITVSETTVLRDCTQEKIVDVQEFLACSKTMFEQRLNNERLKESSPEEFVVHKTIGMGAFGRVMLVNHKSNNNVFLAMKVINKEEVLQKDYLRLVLNEKRLLNAIRHPFIIHMEYFSKDQCNLYFIMPFAIGGDLFGLIREKGSLGEVNAKFYAAQLVLALEYLHAMNVVYRDLKPENVLIESDGHMKITDLGLSKIIKKRTTTICGTPQYLAPEIISVKAYSKAVDWWALGVVLYEMVAGNVPFNANNDKSLYMKILNGIYKMPHHFSADIADLVENLLQNDLSKRYGNLKKGVDDIKEHRWFKTMNWISLYNKEMEPPYKPSYSSPSDTANFESYSDEAASTTCNDVDQVYFDNF